jgi:hypothetical protein
VGASAAWNARRAGPADRVRGLAVRGRTVGSGSGGQPRRGG